jgi:hypothetical protein
MLRRIVFDFSSSQSGGFDLRARAFDHFRSVKQDAFLQK